MSLYLGLPPSLGLRCLLRASLRVVIARGPAPLKTPAMPLSTQETGISWNRSARSICTPIVPIRWLRLLSIPRTTRRSNFLSAAARYSTLQEWTSSQQSARTALISPVRQSQPSDLHALGSYSLLTFHIHSWIYILVTRTGPSRGPGNGNGTF